MINHSSEFNGLLLINKPSGVTSYDVIKKVKKYYSTNKVGHTGTLDPLASGLLCVLIGPSVKACDYLQDKKKTYYAGIKLGVETDTEDITGQIIKTDDKYVSKDDLSIVLNSFKGEYMQTPPMYSSKKVDGKKLYEYARKGIILERSQTQLHIYDISLDLNNGEYPNYYFTCTCSKGTYIRTLCHDIGIRLGTYGTMFYLNRTNCYPYSIDQSYLIEDIENMSVEQKHEILIPPYDFFKTPLKVVLSEFNTKLLTNGCEIYLKKNHLDFQTGSYVNIFSYENKYLGLGEVIQFANGDALKLKIRLY